MMLAMRKPADSENDSLGRYMGERGKMNKDQARISHKDERGEPGLRAVCGRPVKVLRVNGCSLIVTAAPIGLS